jgi:hypothetical protein
MLANARQHKKVLKKMGSAESRVSTFSESAGESEKIRIETKSGSRIL